MKRKGFTLIELLVVIAIIGLLATLAVVAFNSATKKARDAQRLADMNAVVKALELYKDQVGRYPDSDGAGCSGWDTPGDGTFISELKNKGLLSRDVRDPNNNTNCGNYFYYRYPAGTFSCDANRGAFYVLAVGTFETSFGVRPDSPGFKCPDADITMWFPWVTGQFEQ